jgi:hypothetical protein
MAWTYSALAILHSAAETSGGVDVIWSSGIGTVVAVLGIAVGVLMYSPRRRYRSAGLPASIPYQGQKRWHMILGLVFGVAAATWAFSGMHSMDPFSFSTSISC